MKQKKKVRPTHKILLNNKVQMEVNGKGMAYSIKDSMPYDFKVEEIK